MSPDLDHILRTEGVVDDGIKRREQQHVNDEQIRVSPCNLKQFMCDLTHSGRGSLKIVMGLNIIVACTFTLCLFGLLSGKKNSKCQALGYK